MVLKAHIWILVAVVVSLLCLTAPTIEGYERSLAGVAATALAFPRDLAVIDGFPDTPIDHLPSLPSGFTDQVSNFNKGAVGLHDTTATCNSIAGKPLLIHGNHEEADKDAANRASESCERSSTATTYLNGGRCAFTGSRQDERPVSQSSHELKSVEHIDDELSEKRSAPVLAGLKFEVNVVPCSYEANQGAKCPNKWQMWDNGRRCMCKKPLRDRNCIPDGTCPYDYILTHAGGSCWCKWASKLPDNRRRNVTGPIKFHDKRF